MARCQFSTFVFVLTLIWVIILFLTTIGKISVFSLYSYVIHITNFAWSFSNVFYFLTLPFLIPYTRTNRTITVRFASCIVAFCYIPLGVTVFFVSASVHILLHLYPEFITDIFETMEPGIVIIGNDIFHNIPVRVYLIFTLLQAKLIYYSLNVYYVKARETNFSAVFCFTFYQIAIGPFIMPILYFITQAIIGADVNETYMTDIPIAIGFLFLFTVSIVWGTVLLTTLIYCFGLLQRRKNPFYAERKVYTTDYELFGSNDPVLLDEATMLILKGKATS